MAVDISRHRRKLDRQRQFDLGHLNRPALRSGHPIGIDSRIGEREGSGVHERIGEIGRLGNDRTVDAPSVFHLLIASHHGCRNAHLVALIAGDRIPGIGKFHLQRNPVDFHLVDFRNTASVVVHFAAHGIKSHLSECVGHRRRGSGRHSVHIPDAVASSSFSTTASNVISSSTSTSISASVTGNETTAAPPSPSCHRCNLRARRRFRAAAPTALFSIHVS